MTKTVDPIEALAQAIAARVKGAKGQPRFRVVEVPKRDLFDSITREACFRRVRFLRRAYRLDWLVEQHTFNVAGLECLDDGALASLLEDLERARECVTEGVSFEDAGLVRAVQVPEL